MPFPRRQDPEPLILSPNKNLWHCLGAMPRREKASSIWVMRTRGLSFRHAVEILREALSAPAKRLPPPIEVQAEDRDVLRQVVDYYHVLAVKGKTALDRSARLRRLSKIEKEPPRAREATNDWPISGRIASAMRLAANEETVFSLAPYAQNSHPAYRLPTAILHPGFGRTPVPPKREMPKPDWIGSVLVTCRRLRDASLHQIRRSLTSTLPTRKAGTSTPT